jgi:hypothetical protein
MKRVLLGFDEKDDPDAERAIQLECARVVGMV